MMEQFWVDNHYLWRNKRLLLDENIDQGGHFFKEKNIVTQKTNNFDVVFQKCMAHFEAFRWKWNISSSIHLLLLKSVIETCLQLFFLAKTLQVCFPTYHFSKAHCLILGIQFVCEIGKIEHCVINIFWTKHNRNFIH